MTPSSRYLNLTPLLRLLTIKVTHDLRTGVRTDSSAGEPPHCRSTWHRSPLGGQLPHSRTMALLTTKSTHNLGIGDRFFTLGEESLTPSSRYLNLTPLLLTSKITHGLCTGVRTDPSAGEPPHCRSTWHRSPPG